MNTPLPAVPPSTHEPSAACSKFKHTEVTCVTENPRTSPKANRKSPKLTTDGSWELICVPADEIESSDSKWLNSEPEINIAEKNEDDKTYEVVVHGSYVQWLFFFGLERYFDYDPAAPAKEDVLAYGTWEATRRGCARFVRKAANRIRSGCCRGYEDCCRDFARSNGLEIPLQRALLTHDILGSYPPVRKRFTQFLVFLGMNSQQNYSSCQCLELQAKDQAGLLQSIQKCHTDPFRPLLEPIAPIKTSQEVQAISLVRGLLELANGVVDCRQHAFDQEYTTSDNFDLYKTLVGVTGTNQFGDFDPKDMYNALLKSKVFDDTDIGMLDVVAWRMQMMEFLPIGFLEGYLDLPSPVLSGLGIGEVDLVRIYFEHTYHRRPSLRKPENNMRLLLIWSSTAHGRALRVLSEWAISGGALNLFQRLLRDFHQPQEPEQLVLTLAALLCYGRLLPYTSDDTTYPINGCYLADLDVLLRDMSLSNQRTVFERMGFSFLRVLTTLADEYADMIQLLNLALDKDPPLLDPFDGLTDQYVAERFTRKISHPNTYIEVSGLRLMEKMLQLSLDGGSSSQNVDNTSEDYGVEERSGKSLEDTRRIRAIATTNLGEESRGWIQI